MNATSETTLSNLPITLRSSKRRALLLLAGSVAFVAVGVATRGENAVIAAASIGFFGLGAVIALVMLLPGANYLTLDRAGFEFSSLFRRHRVKWQDVSGFHPIQVGLTPMVGWNYRPGWQSSAKLHAVNQALAGVDAALPETYGMAAADLAALLEKSRSATLAERA